MDKLKPFNKSNFFLSQLSNSARKKAIVALVFLERLIDVQLFAWPINMVWKTLAKESESKCVLVKIFILLPAIEVKVKGYI